MTTRQQTHAPEDILSIPKSEIPDTVRRLIEKREFSMLIARVHSDMNSTNPVLRRQGRAVLRRLGFPD